MKILFVTLDASCEQVWSQLRSLPRVHTLKSGCLDTTPAALKQTITRVNADLILVDWPWFGECRLSDIRQSAGTTPMWLLYQGEKKSRRREAAAFVQKIFDPRLGELERLGPELVAMRLALGANRRRETKSERHARVRVRKNRLRAWARMAKDLARLETMFPEPT